MKRLVVLTLTASAFTYWLTSGAWLFVVIMAVVTATLAEGSNNGSSDPA